MLKQIVIATLLSMGGMAAMAQDRMPQIPADKLTEAQKKASAEFAEGRGYAVRGPFAAMLRSPEVMLRAKAMGDYLRFKSTIPPRLNELRHPDHGAPVGPELRMAGASPSGREGGPEARDRASHCRWPSPRRHGGGRGDRRSTSAPSCTPTGASAMPPTSARSKVRRAGHHRPDRRQRPLQLQRHDLERGPAPHCPRTPSASCASLPR